MMRLQHIVRSVLCCLLCLTVCAVPALAGNEQYTDGFFYWSNDAYVNVSIGSQTVNLLNGYFPATVSITDGQTVDNLERDFIVSGKFYKFSSFSQPRFDIPQMYVEILFPVPAPLTVTLSPNQGNSQINVFSRLGAMWNNSTASSLTIVKASNIFSVYDSQYIECTKGSSDVFYAPAGTYDISKYFGFKYVFPSTSYSAPVANDSWGLQVISEMFGNYSFTDPDYVAGIYDEVQVNTGILQEINGSLTEIKISTATIQSDVSEIKDGLQDSNSSIWQSFKDSVSGLFVPSSSDLEGVKDGFDQLAQEKLGGAYQTVELVDNGVQSVVNKFKNPGSSPGVEFPGISVPLGGDVGMVTLAASQTVTIPEKITEVLYPVAGVIIPIVCVIWTIRQCTDMVECFMSGMSYAEFLHRNSDKEDDEV